MPKERQIILGSRPILNAISEVAVLQECHLTPLPLEVEMEPNSFVKEPNRTRVQIQFYNYYQHAIKAAVRQLQRCNYIQRRFMLGVRSTFKKKGF